MQNCLDPDFAQSFEVDYYFEEVQQVRVAVYDLDNKTPKLTDDDFLGEIECTLAQVGQLGADSHNLYGNRVHV